MKTITLTFFIYLTFGLATSICSQESATTIQVKKTDIASFSDIKSLLAAAYPDKVCETCKVQSFILTATVEENNTVKSFNEYSPCGKITEKQYAQIITWNKPGMLFTLQNIRITKHGKPGTLYNPEEQVTLSIPPILFTIKD